MLVRPGGPVLGLRDTDDLLQAVAPLLVALPLCLWKASDSVGRIRIFWQLLGLAAASWGFGQLVWCVLELTGQKNLATNDWSVGGYPGSVFIGAAVIVYPGPRLQWTGRSAIIDGLLIATTLLFVSWTIASDTGALQHSRIQLGERITVLTYPALDIVLLAMLGHPAWTRP